MIKNILTGLLVLILTPIMFIFRPKTMIGLFRVSTYQTEIISNDENRKILRDILKDNKCISTFIDESMTVGEYDGVIDTKGYYGREKAVKFMEIWFKSESDKVMFILKFPDRLTLGKEILARHGNFNVEHEDISKDK